jgi:hypothetical protein
MLSVADAVARKIAEEFPDWKSAQAGQTGVFAENSDAASEYFRIFPSRKSQSSPFLKIMFFFSTRA